MPTSLTWFDRESDDQQRDEVVPRALSAVLIAQRAFDWYGHVAELFIDRKRRPGSCMSGVDVRSVPPRVFAELALAWSRMEAPQLPPGPHIEGHHVRLRELHRFRIARVFERGRNDGDVAEHQR